MGEAYRGLTIKIGGDVSQLKAALRSATQAANETQRQLKRLDNALKLNPGNFATINTKMQVARDNASALAMRLVNVKAQIAMLAKEGGITNLAATTEKAATSAAHAKNEYNRTVEAIAKLRNSLANQAFDKAFGNIGNIERFKQALVSVGAEEKQVAQFAEAWQKRTTAAAEGNTVQVNKLDKRLASLKNNIINTVQETMSWEGSMGKTVAAIRRVCESLDMEEAEIAQVVAEYKRMRAEYQTADAANKSAKRVLDLQRERIAAAELDAQLRAVARDLTAMAVENPAQLQTVQFQRFRQEMMRLDGVIDMCRQDIRAMDEVLHLDPTSLDAARAKFSAIKEEISVTKEKVRETRSQIELLKAAGLDKCTADSRKWRNELSLAEKEVQDITTKLLQAEAAEKNMAATAEGKLTPEYRNICNQITRMEERLAAAKAKLEALGAGRGVKELEKDLIRGTAAIKSLEGRLTSAAVKTSTLRAAFQQLGWSLYSTLTPVMMMFAYKAISSAETIDSAYRSMRKTVQGTEEQFESLKKAAIDFSSTHVTTADQILQIEAMGGQLGIATEKLEGFASAISSIEIATDLDADTASEQLGQLAGIMEDMTQDDFVHYADALVRLGNNSATLESHIQQVNLRIASMGTITGFTAPELLAWSTAVAATGQKAEAAGTSIAKTMSNIESAVGAGGNKLQKFADVAGMSAEEFAAAWNSAPSDTMYRFVAGLKEIEAQGGSADSTLISLGINGARQKQAILGLMQTIGNLNDFLTMSNDAWDGVSDKWGKAGDALNEANKKSQGFSGTIQMLRNNITKLGEEMGESLSPTMNAFGGFVADMTEGYAELSDGMKTVINVFVLLAMAMGPLTVATQAVTSAMAAMKEHMIAKASAEGIVIKEEQRAIEAEKRYQAALRQGIAVSREDYAQKMKKMSVWQRIIFNAKLGAKAQMEETGAVSLATIKSKAHAIALKLEANAFQIARVACKAFSTTLKMIGGFVAFDLLFKAISAVSGALDEAREKAETKAKVLKNLAEVQSNLNASMDATVAHASELSDGYEAVSKMAKESSERTAEFAETLNKSWSDMLVQSANADKCVEKIKELTSATQLSKSQQEQLEFWVQKYNETTGKSVTITDAASGALSESTEELERNKDAWKENLKHQSYLKLMSDTMDEITRKTEEYNEAVKNAAAHPGQYARDGERWISSEAEKTRDRLKAELDALTNTYGMYEKAAFGASEATDDFADSEGDAADYTENLSDEVAKLKEELDDNIDKYPILRNLMDDAGMSTTDLAKKLDEAGLSVNDLTKGIEDYSKKAQDAFNRIEQKTDVSLDQMLQNLQENKKATEEWGRNLKELYGKYSSESARAFLDYMADLGPEYGKILQDMNNQTPEYMQQLFDAFEGGGEAGARAYLAKIGIIVPETESAVDTVTATLEGGKDAAEGYSEDVAAGMRKGEDGVAAAADEISKLAADHMSNAKSDAERAGISMSGEHFAGGILKGQDEVSQAARDLSKLAADHMSAHTNDAYNAGKSMVDGFKRGISDNKWSAINAARDMAAKSVEAAKNAAEINSPSKKMMRIGAGFAEGLALGITRARTQAIAASKEMAESVMAAAGMDEYRVDWASEIAYATASNRRIDVSVKLDRSDLGGDTYYTTVDGITVNDDGRITNVVHETMEDIGLLKRMRR